MEGRIGNHGNQKESEKGREKEALTGRSQSKTSGTRKASPKFFGGEVLCGRFARKESDSVGRFDRGRRNKIRNALLSLWAQDAVSAPPTMHPGLGLETSSSNFLGDFFDPRLGRVNLDPAAFGADPGIPLEVMKDQALGVISPLFASCQGVNGKLQALIRVFLRTWTSGLIVGDDHCIARSPVNPVNPPDQVCGSDLYAEPFFGMQNLSLLRS